MIETTGAFISPQYDGLMQEAHRRAAPPVGAPALVWHMAFAPTPYTKVFQQAETLSAKSPEGAYRLCSPDELRDERDRETSTPASLGNQFNERRWDWIGTADSFINAFRENVANLRKTGEKERSPVIGEAPNPPKSADQFLIFESPQLLRPSFNHDEYLRDRASASLPPPRTQDHIIMNFIWRGRLVKSTFVLHSEFVTITFSIDLSKAWTKTAAARERCSISAAFKALETELGNKPPDAGSLKSLSNELVMKAWTRFATDLLPLRHPFYRPYTLRRANDHVLRYSVGTELIADFRGIVLVAGREGECDLFLDAAQNIDLFAKKPVFQKTGSARAALSRIWPFVEACHGELAREYEFIACKVLTNRVLYISALGRDDEEQTSDDRKQIEVAKDVLTPEDVRKAETRYFAEREFQTIRRVKYLLVLNGLDDFERGKPVYDRWQIGRLIYRINALGTLRLAAMRDLKELRKAGVRVMLLGRYLDQLYTRIYAKSKPAKAERTEQDLIQFFESLSQVGDTIPYGIEYRINRSRYYAGAFRTLVADLGIRRIPGWQTYQAFVRRRLYSVFDSIDQLGGRLQDIRQRANTLLDVVHTRTLLRYQKIAELIVIPAVAYYFSGLLDHLFHTTPGHAIPAWLLSLTPYDAEPRNVTGVATAIGILLTIIAWRFYKQARYGPGAD
jgi:hypothetical protein